MARGKLYPYGDLAALLLSIIAALIVLAAAPFWFEQAMAYSATVGRAESAARAAGAAFSCRADCAMVVAVVPLSISIIVRWIQLRATRSLCLWMVAARDLAEHVVILVGCWMLVWPQGRQEILHSLISSFAKRWCGGG